LRQIADGRSGDATVEGRAATGTLLRVAADMADVFEIESPDAPGLVFLAGMSTPSRHVAKVTADEPLSVGGCGASFADAFHACMGEAVERVAQRSAREGVADGGERASETGDPAAWLRELMGEDPPSAWLPARNLTRGADTALPSALCLRSDPALGEPHFGPLSIGCACGETVEQAITRGLLECVERDAASLWWLAGREPRQIALETVEEAGLLTLIPELRRGSAARRSWLLDITSDLDIPCVVSLSFDAEGKGFAHGLAARPKLADAARSAFFEMCQLEVAVHLVALKAQAGQKLAPVDLRHQQRFADIDAEHLPILRPLRAPSPRRAIESAPGGLNALIDHLARFDLDCLAVELTTPEIGLPVFKTFIPGLQPMPAAARTRRLRAAQGPAGEGAAVPVPLF
jgi:ribosomal protein S12 methylthiotransferase accessory factor